MRISTPGENLTIGSIFDTCIHDKKHIDNVTTRDGLYIAIGYTNTEYVSIDLCKCPHILIAGCTGSGKSVAIHCIINSLLRFYSVDAFQFVMIDPKRVELSRYSKIPYMLYPVITDTEKAACTLDKLVAIMEKRYRYMQRKGYRNYRPDIGKRIVCIIDEYADLVLQYKNQVELPLVRLAQLGRAAGIHLILCTQRPDSKVFSGLLKANIPSRLALKTSSAIDSRIVIDQNGSESLPGKGAAILKTDNGLTRLQVPYISDNEIDSIIDWYTTRKCRV